MQQSQHSSQSSFDVSDNRLDSDDVTTSSAHETPVSSELPNLPSLQRVFDAIPSVRPQTPLLDKIDSPQDLSKLSEAQLITLADELREYLLYCAGVSGGHFGANLGVIELTIALHYLFDTPNDKLVWDVGHQAYAHKVLTGRREKLLSIRAKDGLTAFPERHESEYDCFGVGHSSTAISAGLGMSLALRHQKKSDKVVCVVGDGAMTGGMAFEAMNDAVQQNADLLVILNDNDMSISCAIGGFSRHLAMLWQAGYQVDISASGKPKLKLRPDMNFDDRRARHGESRKIPQVADNLIRAIGFTYFGPFDGHNLPELMRVIQRAKQLSGPVLIHIYTTKGKGFLPAEQDPVGYHAIGKLPTEEQASEDSKQGNCSESEVSQHRKKYSQVFGEFICDKAVSDTDLMAITPAMEEGSGMTEFAHQFPERFFDVAIAEQHAVTLAGGMATQGVKPIVAIYSTFLQRGYDQLIHDIALQNLDVLFAIDRAGLVGEDGATHAGVFDLAFMRCVPNMVIATPKDENECYQLLNTCYEYQGPSAVRYPRGLGVGAVIQKPAQCFEVGRAVIEAVYDAVRTDSKVKQTDDIKGNPSKKVALLAFGTMVATANEVAQILANQQALSVTVVNMRWVKPLDTDMLHQLVAQGVTHMVTLEEHAVMGGAGSAVNEYFINQSATQSVMTNVPHLLNIGIPDRFIAHGSHEQQLADCQLDSAGILARLTQWL
ncbi:1-deoxy-D-xylulose-5-phosphate synthase [Psychrobacter sp. I-STPA6b]|uniref:1-deoxy-D-xylulose-5-phosphate synthase n=1 Tax=Psychrobacter sp. I-STPA6b TaxID=2585718 RepID=UPI001D0C53A4|nr:1-deoxy-D-xylulose-5-phosphate synthase [Psychrobacter sp. I-STPA6b]